MKSGTKFFLVIISVIIINFTAYGSEELKETLVHNGKTRSYRLIIPARQQPSVKYPLVINLHGGGGNGRFAEKMTGMTKKAEREGFMVLYPDGTGRFGNMLLTWNAGNCCGYALDNKSDDIGFIRALIMKIIEKHQADPGRIYVTGLSNGGMMSYALACGLSDMIAAIAPVSGAQNWEPCVPKGPVSVLIFHGTADQHVLYEGGRPKKSIDRRHKRVDTSVKDSALFWIRNNGCVVTPLKEEKGNIIIESYRGGKGGSEVIIYTIKDGGHAWPGGERGSRFGDDPTKEISATDIIWEFFKNHPKKF